MAFFDPKFTIFKPDTAYMEVPRCDRCLHWELDTSHDVLSPASGVCHANVIWSDCNDYTIFTEADFGCTAWKEKP